jgi:hypothetical protein
MIRLQPPQARFTRAPDVIGRQATVVRAKSHRLVYLRGQDNVVAMRAAPEPPADCLFRDAVSLFYIRRLQAAIDVGGVEEVDADVSGGVHDRKTGRFVYRETEVHGPEADPANQQTRATQVTVRHLSAHAGSICVILSLMDGARSRRCEATARPSSAAHTGCRNVQVIVSKFSFLHFELWSLS